MSSPAAAGSVEAMRVESPPPSRRELRRFRRQRRLLLLAATAALLGLLAAAVLMLGSGSPGHGSKALSATRGPTVVTAR